VLGSHLSTLKRKEQQELRKSLMKKKRKAASPRNAESPTIKKIAEDFDTWFRTAGGKTALLARSRIEQQKLCVHFVLMKSVYDMLLSSISGKQ
jgi:hypothetical protein